jgi:radical SAM protein with 4Fe4S-binding SPASM domain
MKAKTMEKSLLEKILQDLHGQRIYELSLVGLGEPLLDKDFSRHLELINNYSSPFRRILLNTNGAFLSKAIAELICKSSINLITFSLNATDRQTYLKMMGQDQFDHVIKNIIEFLKIRKAMDFLNCKVGIQYMSSPLNSRLKIKKIFEPFLADGVTLFERALYNKTVLRNRRHLFFIKKIKQNRHPCWSIFSRIYIDVNGYVYPCAIGNDSYREESMFNIGNARSDNIINIFNNNKLEQARERSLVSKLPFKECQNCNVWLLLPNNFIWDKKSKRWSRVSDKLRLDELNV